MTRNEEMVEMRRAGESYGDIGCRFGITRQRVHQILIKRGAEGVVKLRKVGERRKQRFEMFKGMVESGMSTRQIAGKIGTSRAAITTALWIRGLKARHGGCKLTSDEARGIIDSWRDGRTKGGVSQGDIGMMYGISRQVVGRIVRGSWQERHGYCSTIEEYAR